jgi:cell division protein FtsA
MNLPGVSSVAKRVLRLPATIGQTVGVSSVIDEVKDPSYATAVGLAIWGYSIRSSQRRGLSFLKWDGFGQVGEQIRTWLKSLVP